MSDFARLDQQTSAGGGPIRIAGALLRAPGPLIRELGADRGVASHTASLLAIAVSFCAVYGAVVAMHAHAWWAIAKIPMVVVGSALLCSPTLYVFNSLAGSRLTYAQTIALVLMMAAALSLILVALAPIAWFFGVSTEGFGFMTVLHSTCLAIAVGIGLRVLARARAYLGHLDGTPVMGSGLLALWSALVIVVGMQMAHYFRPILLPGPFQREEPRGLFL